MTIIGSAIKIYISINGKGQNGFTHIIQWEGIPWYMCMTASVQFVEKSRKNNIIEVIL